MQKVVKQMGNLDLIGIEDMEDLELEWVLVELCSLQLFINLFKLNYKLSFLSFFRLCFIGDFSVSLYQIVHFAICQTSVFFLFFDFTDYYFLFCLFCFSRFSHLVSSLFSFLALFSTIDSKMYI